MKLNQNNSKAQFSKDQITSALFRLMQQESYRDISILEICQEAGVSRTTFYRNFSTKDIIIENYVGELISNAAVRVGDPLKLTYEQSAFAELWYEDAEFFKSLYKHGLFPIFTKCLYHYIADLLEKNVPAARGERAVERQYHVAYLAFVTTGLLYEWASRGCVDNREDLARILHSFEEPEMI